MGGKSDTDFGQVATMQGDANQKVVTDQLYANRPTQYTPWGFTSWEANPYTDPGSGETTTRWTQTQGLSSELQDIMNKQIAIQGGRTDLAGGLTGRMQSEFGQALDYSGLTPVGQKPTEQYTLPEGDLEDPYGTRQRAEDAMYNQAQSRIAPQQESQRAALEMKMRNQGLKPGDAAWQSQMQSQGQKFNDQNNQALWSSVGEGRNESGQMFNQGLQANQNTYNQSLQANNQNWNQALAGSQYANQIRQQQIAEMQGQRGQSLNEINALLSGQQVGMPQMPTFSQGQAAAPPPIMTGAAQDASMQNAANPWNSIIGAAGTAGGAYLGNASWT